MEWWLIIEYVGDAGSATMTWKALSSPAECVELLNAYIGDLLTLPTFEFQCLAIK